MVWPHVKGSWCSISSESSSLEVQAVHLCNIWVTRLAKTEWVVPALHVLLRFCSGLYKCNFVASILWRKSSYIVLCKSAFFKHCTQFLSDMSKTYACWILQAGQNVTQSLQTSVITGNSFRSFWLVYSSIDICKLKQNIQLPIVNALQGWLVVWLSMWHTSNFQVLDLKSKISK